MRSQVQTMQENKTKIEEHKIQENKIKQHTINHTKERKCNTQT